MNTRQLVTEIARRLPEVTKREVREVIDVLTELWRVELARPEGEIVLTGLGKLYVERHRLKAAGLIRQRLHARYGADAPQHIERRVIRFRAFEALHMCMNQEENALE